MAHFKQRSEHPCANYILAIVARQAFDVFVHQRYGSHMSQFHLLLHHPVRQPPKRKFRPVIKVDMSRAEGPRGNSFITSITHSTRKQKSNSIHKASQFYSSSGLARDYEFSKKYSALKVLATGGCAIGSWTILK